MAKLVLTFNKRTIGEYPFGKKGGMTIGRKPANDIQIDNLAVSGHHARIDRAGSDYILTDLQSTNGTFVDNNRIVSHSLRHADKIQIGKHVILFLDSSEAGDEKDAGRPESNIDRTMILDTKKQREFMEKEGAPPKAQEKAEPVGVLTFLDNSDLGEVELTKKLVRLGKSKNCEIRLSGVMMGATAATISKRPSGYTISFTGGRTKLKVNGEVIREQVQLNDFDTVEIGHHRFQFYHRVPDNK